ncbi:hypothetical protein V2J52_02780 [Georgenia sp. MJ173]|uniref:hypothetical protein n=1 Tax=Georgenia sunbinii TaxID=3117728 RepID=UPI002F26A6BA
MATVTRGAPGAETFKTLRGRLASLSHWHPERTEEICALKAELATLAIEHEIRQALDAHDLNASQLHRIASTALGGVR